MLESTSSTSTNNIESETSKTTGSETVARNGRADKIFDEEQAHLTRIYAILQKEYHTLQESMNKAHAQAQHDLADMSSEVRQNFGSDDEAMETYAAIETLNAVIDSYNQKHDFDADRLKRIATLLLQPYFAKIVLRMRPGRPAQDVYIGAAGITDSHRAPLIVDWRSPVAQTYYEQQIGPCSYTVHGRERKVTLELRRQFDITKNKLNAYFDSDVAIEDALLMQALTHHHSEKLKAITATIQREQNTIIRYDDVDALIIEGIAGSGKTSVLLQRIAYLLYQQKDTLRAEDVCLFAPNDVFRHYIDMVLPQLGEQNPTTYTWKSFIEARGLLHLGEGANTTLADLDCIDAAIPSISITTNDLCDICAGSVVLLKRSSIEAALEKFAKYPFGARRLTLTKDELHTRLERKISMLAHEEELQEKMQSLDVDEQMEIFGEVIAPRNDEEILRYAKQFAKHLFGSCHEAIDDERWLRFDKLCAHMLQRTQATAVEVLYLQQRLMGSKAPNVRFVMIDEVQDYTPAQLKVLGMYFSHAHITLAGDEHQAISEQGATIKEIAAVMRAIGKHPVVLPLTTSYRSTPEITSLFWNLFDAKEGVHVESVQPEGTKPQIVTVDAEDQEGYLTTVMGLLDAGSGGAALKAACADVQDAGAGCTSGSEKTQSGLQAIIMHDTRGAKWMARNLRARGCHAHLITNESMLEKNGCVVMSIKLAKGLEFDHVILADAQEAHYPSTGEGANLARRQLYTAISRATKRIDIVAQGELTGLLAQ